MSSTSDTIMTVLKSFMDYKTQGRIKIYNEISLQLELGVYLRDKLKGFSVRFERNIEYYKPQLNKDDFTKREIDIVLFKGSDEPAAEEKYAIELKFPRKGQYPEQMFAFLKDIKFMEEVKSELNFNSTFCLTLVDDKNFYKHSERSNNPIYSYFRIPENEVKCICADNSILKPTGTEYYSVKFSDDHIIQWQHLGNNCDWTDKDKEEYRYYIVKI